MRLPCNPRQALLFLIASALLAPLAKAFPPAPYFTLYGLVRNEQGQTLNVEGAVVVFYVNGVEKARQNITQVSGLPDQNYQLRLRMDMQSLGTQSYSELVNSTGTKFTLAILINSIPYYPIEMAASRVVGSPGQRVRLDLTLGVDSDGDGLPDEWEKSQLYAAGVMPGSNGWDLSLISRDGDYDRDGRSNYNEYVAGTYATDPKDFLVLRIVGKTSASVRLRFYGIYGKVYSLESSTDLKTWSPEPLYLRSTDPNYYDPKLGAPAAQSSLQAGTSGLVDIYAQPGADAAQSTYYRLNVR